MSRDVEFLDIEDAVAGVEDLAEGAAAPRRLARRRFVAVAAAAAVVAVLIFRTPAGSHDRTIAAPPVPHRVPVPPPTLTMPGPDPFGAGNLVMTFGGGRLFGLSSTRLGVLDPAHSVRRSADISLDLGIEDAFGLVWDAPAGSVWLLPLFGREPGILREYGPDLRLRRTVPLADVAHAATVLDGVLYVSTSSGIQRIGRSGPARPVPIPNRAFHRYGAFGDVQADPTRHRLLYLTYGYSAYLETWSPRTGRSSVVQLGVANPTMAVVAGRIWVAGFRRTTGVVEQLDPHTLRPVAQSPLAAELGPGAVIVDAGHESIFVRSGTDPGPLWCLDADGGFVRQRWDGPPGPVSGSGANLFVAATAAVRPLTVEGCPG